MAKAAKIKKKAKATTKRSVKTVKNKGKSALDFETLTPAKEALKEEEKRKSLTSGEFDESEATDLEEQAEKEEENDSHLTSNLVFKANEPAKELHTDKKKERKEDKKMPKEEKKEKKKPLIDLTEEFGEAEKEETEAESDNNKNKDKESGPVDNIVFTASKKEEPVEEDGKVEYKEIKEGGSEEKQGNESSREEEVDKSVGAIYNKGDGGLEEKEKTAEEELEEIKKMPHYDDEPVAWNKGKEYLYENLIRVEKKEKKGGIFSRLKSLIKKD